MKIYDVNMEFTCPKCKGHCFDTDIKNDIGICTGMLFGEHVLSCGFKWPRSEDDKYFNLRKKER